MAKPALGKGFDALINQNLSRESLAAPQAGDVVHQLSHASIIPSSLQPRAIFTPEQLAELVDSIKEHGIIQPLIVRKTESGKYELIAGERRWRASGILGLSTVPAIIRKASDKDVLALALVENLIFPLCGLLCLMLILSGIMASSISKRIVKPINELDLESPEENRIYEELSPLLSKIHRQNREIQNQLELAKQQQEEFALITENMQEGLIVIDKYTMILSANSSAWNLFHMDRAVFYHSKRAPIVNRQRLQGSRQLCTHV